MSPILKTIEVEKQKIRRYWRWYVFSFFIFGVVPWFNYQFIDGIYYNQVVEFREDINPKALRTDKDEYCPGEAVKIETAFCKTRNTIDIERSMYISNGNLTSLDVPKAVAELPVGCVPSNDGVVIATLHTIPEDTLPGFHITVGNNQYTLEGGRKRQLDYQTIPYMVLPADQCNLELAYENTFSKARRR